jgi:hypothetical protein
MFSTCIYLLLFVISRHCYRLWKRLYLVPACEKELHTLLSSAERWRLHQKTYYKQLRKRADNPPYYFLLNDSCFLLMAFLFFLLSSLQQSPANLPPLMEQTPTLDNRSLTARLLGLSMRDCLHSRPEDLYCHFTSEWETPVRDGFRYSIKFLANRDPSWRRFFVDESGEYYYPQHLLVDVGSSPALMHSGVTLVREGHLTRQLTELHLREGAKCICPAFLGILDNVSFHLYHTNYDKEKRWLIMHDPVLYRNSSDARLVLTTPLYGANSPFSAFSGPSQQAHYETFLVEFSAPNFQFDDAHRNQSRATLTGYNNRLYEHYCERGLHWGRKMFILQQLNREKSVDRLRLQLSGEDASCFIYCQRLARS